MRHAFRTRHYAASNKRGLRELHSLLVRGSSHIPTLSRACKSFSRECIKGQDSNGKLVELESTVCLSGILSAGFTILKSLFFSYMGGRIPTHGASPMIHLAPYEKVSKIHIPRLLNDAGLTDDHVLVRKGRSAQAPSSHLVKLKPS